MNSLQYIKEKLAPYLGEEVITPLGRMFLVEIYHNGNVACIPLKCSDYHKELKEFHAESVKYILEK